MICGKDILLELLALLLIPLAALHAADWPLQRRAVNSYVLRNVSKKDRFLKRPRQLLLRTAGGEKNITSRSPPAPQRSAGRPNVALLPLSTRTPRQRDPSKTPFPGASARFPQVSRVKLPLLPICSSPRWEHSGSPMFGFRTCPSADLCAWSDSSNRSK